MRLIVWIFVGWLFTAVVAALHARWHTAHLMPNGALVVVVFLALRRAAPAACVTAWVLGDILGVMAAAPQGLHALALMGVALGCYGVSGRLDATGGGYNALITVAADMAYHLLLVLLLMAQSYPVGFSSWATALLLPQALLSGLLSLACYRLFSALDAWLTPQTAEGLQWH